MSNVARVTAIRKLVSRTRVHAVPYNRNGRDQPRARIFNDRLETVTGRQAGTSYLAPDGTRHSQFYPTPLQIVYSSCGDTKPPQPITQGHCVWGSPGDLSVPETTEADRPPPPLSPDASAVVRTLLHFPRPPPPPPLRTWPGVVTGHRPIPLPSPGPPPPLQTPSRSDGRRGTAANGAVSGPGGSVGRDQEGK